MDVAFDIALHRFVLVGDEEIDPEVLTAIRQNEERVTFLQPNTNARGTDLLANPAAQIEPPMLEFFKKFVKDADSEWRSRKSRYDRDTTAQ